MAADAEEVTVVAKHVVRPSSSSRGAERIHLAPWDLRLLTIQHIQKGLLFSKPQHKPFPLIVSDLFASFSHAVDHFYPLAGRLYTTKHPEDSSISISLDCTGDGADFVHASALHVRISDILTSRYVPPVVHSFFPLNGDIAYDGHSRPLLAAQVTELADGIFIGCSLNHAVGDGTAFWNFFKTWSTLCRTGEKLGDSRQVFDRWFPDSCPPPVRLPFTDPHQFITTVQLPPLPECAFEFSLESVKKLKARANKEMGGGGGCDVTISSLQALLAHVWRSAARARALESQQETSCYLSIGYRSRLRPPLPESYLGNSAIGFQVKAMAGEIESKGLGWTAWLLNRAVAEHGDGAAVHDMFELWAGKRTLFFRPGEWRKGNLGASGSPRFDIYGNDFGWGRPVGVRSGAGNKVDGKVTVYPGEEEGGIAMEICLPADVLSSLLQDEEFMAAMVA